jgi:hypothetical protein
VVQGGAQLGAVERQAGFLVVRVFLENFGVFDDGPVVVLALFGELARPDTGGDTPGRQQGHGQCGRQSPGESVSYRHW